MGSAAERGPTVGRTSHPFVGIWVGWTGRKRSSDGLEGRAMALFGYLGLTEVENEGFARDFGLVCGGLHRR